MITENLSTLKIHKLTQEQYDRAAAEGNLETDALYLTPAKEIVGGSLEPLIVTAISDTEVDKSVDEIRAAVESGRDVFFSPDGNAIVALMTIIESTIDEPNSASFCLNVGEISVIWNIVGNSYETVRYKAVRQEDIPTDDHINGLIDKKMSGNQWILTDENTGKKYKLAVIDGSLTMTEVE